MKLTDHFPRVQPKDAAPSTAPAHAATDRPSAPPKVSDSLPVYHYLRVYHWMPAKSIKPLEALAEVNTLEGSVTLKSHFFSNCGQTGQIRVREVACLTCEKRREQRFGQCTSTNFCGHLLLRPVQLKSGGRDSMIQTRFCTGLQEAGVERAALVQPGMMVGSECSSEAEPYVVSLALTEEKIWEGEDGSSWMGTITAGVCVWACACDSRSIQVTSTLLQESLSKEQQS